MLPRIDSTETAMAVPHAMVSPTGDVFYPDNPDDAVWFAVEHDAVPLDPDVFPWSLDGLS